MNELPVAHSLTAFEVEVNGTKKIIAKPVSFDGHVYLYREAAWDVAFLRKWGALSFDVRVIDGGWLEAYHCEEIHLDTHDGWFHTIPVPEFLGLPYQRGNHGEAVQAYARQDYWDRVRAFYTTDWTNDVTPLGPVKGHRMRWSPIRVPQAAPPPRETTRRLL